MDYCIFLKHKKRTRMAVTYKKLWRILLDRDIKKEKFTVNCKTYKIPNAQTKKR